MSGWEAQMTKNMTKTLKLLEQEFQLQFITASLVVIFFMLSFTMTKIMNPVENELPKLFIIFYALSIGLVLPWQLNTRGHIELGYCRYHLSLPVRTWKLSVIPLLFRIILVILCLCMEALFYTIYYGESSYNYVTIDSMFYYGKMALLIYIVLQAYAWSKESFNNLYQWLILALIACCFIKYGLVINVIEASYYPLVVLFFVILGLAGVRNMRFGEIIEFPGIQNLFSYKRNKLKSNVKEKKFKSKVSTQMHYEWKRTWYFMPMLTLFFIVVTAMIQFESSGTMHLETIIIFMGMVYFLMTLLVPILGMLFIQSNSFKSSFVNHLPISSKDLAEIKIKCFSKSFTICLGMFFIWLYIRLFFLNSGFRDRIYNLNTELTQSPGVVIWLIATLIIWAYALAFFMVTTYSRHRLLSIILPTAVVMFYLNQYNIFGLYMSMARRYWGSPLDLNKIPFYIPLAIMIFLMVVIKFGLFYLHKSSPLVKAGYIVTIFFVSLFYILLANFLVVLTILPVVLLFVYPVMAQKQKITWQRHELDRSHINIPWKLVTVVSLVLVVFAAYTFVLNQQQNKELYSVIKSCNAVKSPQIKKTSWGTFKQFINEKMPYQDEYEAKYKKYVAKQYPDTTRSESSIYNKNNLYRIYNYLGTYIWNLIKQKQYGKAMQYLLFKYEIEDIKYEYEIEDRFAINRVLYLQRNSNNLYMILKNKPSPEALSRLHIIQKRCLLRRLSLVKNYLIKNVDCVKEQNISKVYPDRRRYYIVRHSKREITLNGFRKLYLSPMIINNNLHYCRMVLHFIKGIDYALGHDNVNILSYKVNTSLVNRYIHGYNVSNSFNKMQSAIANVAIARFRAKYGKPPAKIDGLVPEFLEKKDLMIFVDPYAIRRGGGGNAGREIHPVMTPLTMHKTKPKKMKQCDCKHH
jgi:hypothetical protein